jgi:hypothetical protein
LKRAASTTAGFQNYQRTKPGFFHFAIFSSSWTGDHPQEEGANFGQRSDSKVEVFKNPA